ncbi:hypothetical protein EW121_12755 [Vibrio cholerae]|nr:hypothetical protein [Vibrio cholerae]EGR0778448.1 hypothetical protein [Vibrio cholerae]EGR0782138.1 hypothetical protein [Vibrio cholerae]EGR0823553.1 hypothetical protein [Vibrio cholerae]EGR0831930.1 hypothetical protein [Vibrio cholerae]
MDITFITPFDCKDKNSYLYERAKYFLLNSYMSENVKRIFVDFSSDVNITKELMAIAKARNIKYISLKRFGELFSIGVCRNTGVLAAVTKYISFQDVDLYAPDFIYKKIERRIAQYQYVNEMEMIPCLYLTESYSKEYLHFDDDLKDDDVKIAYLENNKEKIQMFAPASSCQIVEREFYLMSGGINKEFYGHGYEDFELHLRLCDLSKKFYRTHSITSHDYAYDSHDYRGYRPYFSMFGRPMMNDGIYFVHLWHDNHVGTNYQRRNRINKGIFERLIAQYVDGKSRVPIISDSLKSNKILVLSSNNSINSTSLRHLFVSIGNCIFRDESLFSTFDDLNRYIESEMVERVFFFNPYGNEHRLGLYRKCKENNIPFYVFDRGALNDSWFIDPNGFNGDSSTYEIENWNVELDSEVISETVNYINQTFLNDETLEENGPRIGVEYFRERYALNGKKVLFVPFQRPNDSVIKYFSGSVDNIEDFTHKLRVIADLLSNEWVVVAKKHPLESKLELPENVISLPSSMHIYDCIQGSDAVLLINSGVGLLSIMANKPVYHFGVTYYGKESLACRVYDEKDAVNKIRRGFVPNNDHVIKFVHYLINHVYSFAKTEYVKVEEGNATRNVAVATNFYRINILNEQSKSYLWRTLPHPVNSRYYDFFRGYLTNKNQSPQSKTVENKVSPNDDCIVNNDKQIKVVVKNNKKYGTTHKLKKLIKDPVGVLKRKVLS